MASVQQFFDVEDEYRRNPNFKREDINILRKFIETEYRKPSDRLLFLMLHSCYYDIEAAKNTIVVYYKIRSSWPQVFRNRNPSLQPLKDHLPVTVTWPLKKCTKEGYRIVYSAFVDKNPAQYNLIEQVKLYFDISEFLLNTYGNGEGFTLVFDAKGLSWGHVLKFEVGIVKKYVEYVQDALPIRLKGVHIINTGVMLEKLLTIVRMFMNKEMHDIMHVHSDVESLYKYIPKNCFVKDYGGDDVTIKELQQEMMDTLLTNAELFEDDETPTHETAREETFRYFDDC